MEIIPRALPPLGSSSDTELWRIDELARRSGLTVDTIRFYQREGLLTDTIRVGRKVFYDERHLRQLVSVKRLQEHRFSLAAIRGLVEDGHLEAVDAMFTSGEPLQRAQLRESCGLSDGQLQDLERLGFVEASPDGFFEASDVRSLQAVAGLADRGVPWELILGMLELYVASYQAIEDGLFDLLSGGAAVMDKASLEDFFAEAAGVADELLSLASVIPVHLHQRLVRKLAERVAHEVEGDTAL